MSQRQAIFILIGVFAIGIIGIFAWVVWSTPPYRIVPGVSPGTYEIKP